MERCRALMITGSCSFDIRPRRPYLAHTSRRVFYTRSYSTGSSAGAAPPLYSRTTTDMARAFATCRAQETRLKLAVRCRLCEPMVRTTSKYMTLYDTEHLCCAVDKSNDLWNSTPYPVVRRHHTLDKNKIVLASSTRLPSPFLTVHHRS